MYSVSITVLCSGPSFPLHQLLYDFGTIIKESETITEQYVLHLSSPALQTVCLYWTEAD
jgi:hypothetical protein